MILHISCFNMKYKSLIETRLLEYSDINVDPEKGINIYNKKKID